MKKLEIKYDIKEITESITEEILKKNVDKFYKMLYQIHCNPNIKEIFPSIIYFNTHNETNNLSQESDQLLSYLKKVDAGENSSIKNNTLPQHYFIPMGQENDKIYQSQIHKFISVMPKGPLQNSSMINFELFIESLANLGKQFIP